MGGDDEGIVEEVLGEQITVEEVSVNVWAGEVLDRPGVSVLVFIEGGCWGDVGTGDAVAGYVVSRTLSFWSGFRGGFSSYHTLK